MHLTTPKMIDVGHSKVAYRVTGTGPDVLFIHGWPLNGSTFRDVIPLLKDDFRCHVVDLPGAGDSVFDRESKIGVEAHVDAVLKVIDEIGLGDFAIVAHDSGGAIARYVASQLDIVRAMVLSGTEIPGHTPLLITALMATSKLPGADRTLRRALASPAFRRSALGFGGAFKDKGLIEGEFFTTALKPILDSQLATFGAMELIRTFHTKVVDRLRDVHPLLKMPVQLIWGSDDPFFPVELAREMAGQFPNGRIHVVDGAKLLVHEEFPEEFAAVTRQALS